MSHIFVWAEHNPEFLPHAIAYAMRDDGECLGGHTAPTPEAAMRELKLRMVLKGLVESDIEIVPAPVYDHAGWVAASRRARGAYEHRAYERSGAGWNR